MLKKLALAAVLSAFASYAYADITAPSNVVVTALSSSTIQVQWTDNSTDESGFRVWIANTNGGAYTIAGEVGPDVTTFVAGGLPADTQRFFRVQAIKHSTYTPEDKSNLTIHAQTRTLASGPTNQPPIATDDTGEGQAPTTVTGNVLVNDTDPNNDPLTVVSPSHAEIAANGDYSIDFEEGGVFEFNYTVSDGRGGTDTGKLTVTVEEPVIPNVPPVAGDDTYNTQRDVVLNGNVLGNDTDSDGGTLAVTPITSGPFILQANGDFEFTAPPAPTTVVTVDYELLDGQGGSDIGTVTINISEPPPVNEPPVAMDDFNSGEVNTTITGNVLTNDTDPENDNLHVQQPAGIITSSGTYSFSSPTAGIFNHPYTVVDEEGATDAGNLQITVTDVPVPPDELVAFPGADGAGRFAKGGRGGAVIYVDNLNDSGPGSYRACLTASGPRTCIFRVSGYINLLTRVHVTNPYLTVAGETSPNGVALRWGPGMCCDLTIIATHDVIIRHMKYRGGGPAHTNAGAPNGRNLMLGDILGNNPTHDVIVDHSSFSWATDQPFDVSPDQPPGDVSRLTIQDSLIYEGLRPHSKGANYRACGISTIRTMLASNTIRNPNNTCGIFDPDNIRSNGGITGETEFRNNVVYNGQQAFFDMWDGRGNAFANIVGNVFKKGPDSMNKLNNNMLHGIYPVDAWYFGDRQVPSGTCAQNNKPNCASDADELHMYLNDNIAIGFGSIIGGNPIHGVLNPNDAHLVSANPVGDGVFEDGLLGPAMPSSQVVSHITNNAGAFPNHRDAADARIINDMNNGTGSIPYCTQTSSSAVCDLFPQSNYPAIAMGTPYPDADTDGMDDTYEASNGVTNPNGDIDGDGYTNLEEFLHQLAATR